MIDDPTKIADWLLDQHGPDGAYSAALEGVSEANREGPGYRLSIWRDVKRTILERTEALKNEGAIDIQSGSVA